MDKTQLNLEVVSCRQLVKKAKVWVIRKLLKKVKILRSCKNEETKEKKFRKARRLIAEVHAIKALSPDFVTKFALVTESYIFAGSNTKLKRKKNACAKLAKHREIVARVNAIRGKFENWREQLPPLLKSVKKKKDKVTNESKTENNKVDESPEKYNDENSVNSSEEDENGANIEDMEVKEGEENEENEVEDDDEDDKNDDIDDNYEVDETDEDDMDNEAFEGHREDISGNEAGECRIEESSNEDVINNKVEVQNRIMNKSFPALESSKIEYVKNRLKKGMKKKKEIQLEDENPRNEKLGSSRKGEMENCNDENTDGGLEMEKIDDPFFIGKKVIVPKLLQKNNENNPEREKNSKRELSEDMEQEFKIRKKRNVIDKTAEIMEGQRERIGLPARKKQPLVIEDLHPSWKAKKMQTLKPFKGKKIIFN